MKFVIVSPRQRSGGSIVLHQLCHYLEDQGHDARIFLICRGCFSHRYNLLSWGIWCLYNIADFVAYLLCRFLLFLSIRGLYEKLFYEPVKNTKRWYGIKVPDDVIVIYPEIIYGNPLKAAKVVRWLLYFNRFEKDDAFCTTDLVFCYREIFNDYKWNPQCRKLGFSFFDFDMYRQVNYGSRKGICYVLRKGKNRTDLPHKFDGQVLDNLSEREKVRILNSCKYCYLYDTQTFYSTIAAVCGAIPVVIMEPGKKKNDYIGMDDVVYGVAYGLSDEEIKFAQATRKLCIENLKTIEAYGNKQVKEFVITCRNYFYRG